MFVCRSFDGQIFGVGETLMMAFEDMVENMELSVDDDSPDPRDCEFFEQIEVNIRETKTWSIEPQYEFEE